MGDDEGEAPVAAQEDAGEPGEPEAEGEVRLHLTCRGFRRQRPARVEAWLKEVAPDCELRVVHKALPAKFCFVALPSAAAADAFARRAASAEWAPGDALEVRQAAAKRPRADADGAEGAAPPPPAKRPKKRTLAEALAAGDTPLLELRQWLAHPSKDLTLAERVTPLAALAYERQLALKEQFVRTCLRRLPKALRDELGENQPEDLPWWASGTRDPQGCVVEPAAAPPATARTHYRNQCTWTLGCGDDGRLEVGFVRSRRDDGEPVLGDPSSLALVQPALAAVRVALKSCVEESLGQWPVYSRVRDDGVWRLAAARANPAGEVLLLVQVANLAEGDLPEVRERLQRHLLPASGLEGEGGSARVLGVYAQLCKAGAGGDAIDSGPAPILLTGEGCLEVPLFGSAVRLGPLSFLQVNLPACELLYGKVLDWLAVSAGSEGSDADAGAGAEPSLLLDVCCGAGSFAVAASGRFREVIGVEVCEEAVESARENAERAKASNCRFLSGAVADVLPELLAGRIDASSHTVAFVDPPRTGIGRSALAALRRLPALSRIVYAACHPERFAEEAAVLCRPARGDLDGQAFRPLRCCAVDMFPQTAHCEMLVLLVRDDGKPPLPVSVPAKESDAPDSAGGSGGAAE